LKLKVFTLRFSNEANGFDDAPMQAFLADKQVVEVTNHFFVHENVPYLTLLVSYRDVEGLEREFRNRRKDPRMDLDQQEQQIYDALRAWRSATAKQEGIPPYVIVNNRQLAQCVKMRAQSKAGLVQVRGIGEAKIERYGEMMLEILKEHPPQGMGKPEAAKSEADRDS